jgi:hypothetical protein
MEHEKLIEKYLGINTPYWIKEKVNNAINEALRQPPVISSFACLSDDNSCEKQCDACKFVENGLKQANDL